MDYQAAIRSAYNFLAYTLAPRLPTVFEVQARVRQKTGVLVGTHKIRDTLEITGDRLGQSTPEELLTGLRAAVESHNR